MSSPHSEPEVSARVVLLCGISGSGKTYYARKLEDKGYIRLSSDGIAWSRYGAALQAMSPEHQRVAFMEAAAEIDAELTRIIKEGGKAVVDATHCKRTRRDALRDMCREAGIEPDLVYMDAPLDLLVERMKHREGLGPDDQIVSKERLFGFFNGFERPDEDEKPLVVKQ